METPSRNDCRCGCPPGRSLPLILKNTHKTEPPVFGVDKKKVFNFKIKVDRWGSVLAFFSWLPIIGDVIAVSLGFFRTNFILVSVWMLFGKILRYIIWGSMTYWSLSILN